MPFRRTKLSHRKADKLLAYFVGEVTARTSAGLAGVNKDTAALFYRKIRWVIGVKLAERSPFDGEVGVDESYFGGSRKGKRGRGAAGKVPAFGILKRGGKIYTAVMPDLSSEILLPIIRNKVVPDSIVYTDGLRSYDVLDVGEFKHQRIYHEKVLVTGGKHINGIENFWNQAKRVLHKYNGIPKQHFPLFIKKCEFRFNYGTPTKQIKTPRRWLKEQDIL